MGELTTFDVPEVGGEGDPHIFLFGACRALRRDGIDTRALEAYGTHPYLTGEALAAATDLVCRAELFLVTGLGGAEQAQAAVNEAAGLALNAVLGPSVQERFAGAALPKNWHS